MSHLEIFFPIDPPSVEQVQNVTVMEGTHVTKECNVTTGTPPINIFWEDVKSGQVFEGKLLNITDITRYQTEYRKQNLWVGFDDDVHRCAL